MTFEQAKEFAFGAFQLTRYPKLDDVARVVKRAVGKYEAEADSLRQEVDRQRQRIKNLEAEVAALEYLDGEADIGAKQLCLQLHDACEEAQMYRTDSMQVCYLAQQQGLYLASHASSVDVMRYVLNELQEARARIERQRKALGVLQDKYNSQRAQSVHKVKQEQSSEIGKPKCWIFTQNEKGEEVILPLEKPMAVSPYLDKQQARKLAEILM